MTTKMNNWQLSDANANFQQVCEMFLIKGALVLGTLLTVQLSEEQIRRCRFRISLSTAGKWSLYTRLSALKSTSSPGFSRLEKRKNPPRTQASSWIFPISLTGDVTSEIAEDDWERGCRSRDEVWEEFEEIPLPHHCREQLCREHKYSVEGIHNRKFADHREDDTTCYKP